MVILPFSAIFLMVLKGFVYTIAVYFYAFRLAFSSILACVQHQNALHLAPKRTAFSTKTLCIQHQNALHLAPKRTAFSGILHPFSSKQLPKRVQMTVLIHKNSSCLHAQTNPFCIKTNLRENRLFAARWEFDAEKGSQNVKIYAEKRTKLIDELTS